MKPLSNNTWGFGTSLKKWIAGDRLKLTGDRRLLCGFALVFCVAGFSALPCFAQEGQTNFFTFFSLAGSGDNPGSADGLGTNAQFNNPNGTAVDANFNIFVADTGNNTIRKIITVETNWAVSTLAGLAAMTGTNDGSNSVARFNSPESLTVDSTDNVFVADTSNNVIRKVFSLGTNWVVKTIAGSAGTPGSSDGTNSRAQFNGPQGITVGGNDTLYVSDTGNDTIRKLISQGTNWVVTTIAGTAGTNGGADGTNGLAQFNAPEGIAMDGAGNLYVADSGNNTIRKISPLGTNWIVTTIAGLAGVRGSNDGSNSGALFFSPGGITVDSATNLYVTDSGNDTIREIVPSGPLGTNWVVTTIGGIAGEPGYAGGSGTNALFTDPKGIAVNSFGNLFVDGPLTGGVITLTEIGGGQTPVLVEVPLDPPTAVTAGAAWKQFGVNESFAVKDQTQLISVFPAILQFSNLIGWNAPVAPPLPITLSLGLNVVPPLSYTVVPPVMSASRTIGLGIAGTTNTTYAIQYCTNLLQGSWQTLTTVSLPNGTNNLEPWPPPWPFVTAQSGSNATFFRAQWTGN